MAGFIEGRVVPVQQDQLQAYHVYVSGKVQGVYYRASTAKKAQLLGLSGWVKNLTDGRVELFAQGPVESLEQLLSWCQKGPILAKISDIEYEMAQVDANMAQFEVMR
ncbi:MAG: acylphosphatase [Oceanicoccus sp.]|jgi:acylphosphatase